jgi:hypothetical protein
MTKPPEEEEYENARLLPILIYVLGFMVVLGLLAFAAAWILRPS